MRIPFSFGRLAAAAILIAVFATLLACPSGPGSGQGEVSGLAATPGNGQVLLAWTEPTYSGYSGGDVSCTPGSAAPLTFGVGTSTLTVTGLTNDTTYTFVVRTVDASGNWSAGVSIDTTPSGTAVENSYRLFNNGGVSTTTPSYVNISHGHHDRGHNGVFLQTGILLR